MKRCLSDEGNGFLHHQIPIISDVPDSSPLSSYEDDSGPRKLVAIGDDDWLRCDEEEYPSQEEDDRLPLYEPVLDPNEPVPVSASFPEPWPPFPREEFVMEDDGRPPPGILLTSAADNALLWKSVGKARGLDTVYCMMCKSRMQRRRWLHHMKQQHRLMLATCPYNGCGWKFSSPKWAYRHILRQHDQRPWRCHECPTLLFDSQSAMYKHQCRTHRNWPRHAFHLDTGDDPLHEDDEGFSPMESTADLLADENGVFNWRASVYHSSALDACRTVGGWSSSPKPGKLGASSKAGQCITGLVPW
jgi:hypothetical protein